MYIADYYKITDYENQYSKDKRTFFDLKFIQ